MLEAVVASRPTDGPLLSCGTLCSLPFFFEQLWSQAFLELCFYILSSLHLLWPSVMHRELLVLLGGFEVQQGWLLG